ncbi:MAG: carboxypeptidase regulatory-like domain-containing protein [Planctomycetes bacterium]|nr:carboxypeptidase regulatory-like domain-containing protein [Planctomycetota bacterium]
MLGALPAFLAWLRRRPRVASCAAVVIGLVLTTILLRFPLRGTAPTVLARGPGAVPAEAGAVGAAPLSAAEPSSDVASRSLEGASDERRRSWSVDLEGTVLDVDRSPVPDAEIVLGYAEGTSRRVVARSDISGSYRAANVDALEWVWAKKDGRLPARRQLVGSAHRGKLDLELSKDEGRLRGRIIAATGAPVAGARVVCRYERPNPDRHVIGAELTLVLGVQAEVAVTDGDGRFQILRPTNPNQYPAFLFIRADGQPPQLHPVPDDIGEREIELRLPPPGRLAGRIVGRDGMPVANAPLEVLLPAPFDARRATTNDWGEYDIDGLPRSPYALRLLRHTSGALESCFVRGEIGDENPSAQSMVLTEDSILHGRVVESGAPVAGRRIRLRQSLVDGFPPDDRSELTGEDGTFVFTGCDPNGRFCVQLLDASGRFVHAEVRELTPSRDPLRVETDGPAALGTLSAICHADGVTLPTMVAVHGVSLQDPLILPIEADGSFSTPPIPVGRYLLRFWIPSVGTWGMAHDLTADAPPARFEFGRPGSLEIRVLTPHGEILPESIRVNVSVLPFLDMPGLKTWRTLALDNGIFRADLPPGDHYQLQVRAADFSDELRRVTIEGGRTAIQEVRLQESIPMRIELVGSGDIRRERFTITLEESDQTQQSIGHVNERKGVKNVIDLRMDLPKDLVGIRVRSLGGLWGRMPVAPAELIPNGVLTVKLEPPTERQLRKSQSR